MEKKLTKIAVVGMGYVGMPLAVAFAEKNIEVIGFDVNSEKINQYKNGIDPTEEVGDEVIKNTNIMFTSDENDLDGCGIYIIAVPTPVNSDGRPNLRPVINASSLVGKHIQTGGLVLYESTVYPGVTEDLCIPQVEQASGLKAYQDFKFGYSPERINPGDKVHRLNNIVKIVSGCDAETLETVAELYQLILDNPVFKAKSIKVAEAAKLAENSQRDVNIAFVNELALVFERMGIDTVDVIEAMNTKWNALGFYPGLVGGHCIGVDPYYFIYEAHKLGFESLIVSGSRRINDGIPQFIVDAVVRNMGKAGLNFSTANVYILGATFKENCPDMRNSKVFDIYEGLKNYGVYANIIEPVGDEIEVKEIFGVAPQKIHNVENADCIICAVAHNDIKNISIEELNKMYRKDLKTKIFIDIKSIFNREELEKAGFTVWRL